MKFKIYAEYLSQLEITASRNELTVVLAKLIQELKPEEIKPAIYLLQGRIAPQYVALEFAFSTKMILKSLVKPANKSLDLITDNFKKVGDIGLVVAQILTERESRLDINTVFTKLKLIAETSGKSSQNYKEQIYLDLLSNVSNVELKFINRILTGNLRLGISTKTLLDALSWSISGDKKYRTKIEAAFGVRSDLGNLAELILTQGIDKIDQVAVQPGIPISPKLVEREKDVAEVFKRLPVSLVQPKLDGLRIHIHFNRKGFNDDANSTNEMHLVNFDNNFDTVKNTVRLFSRNLESLTSMFPEIVSAAAKLKANSFIIDGEIIGIDDLKGTFLAFQETVKRRRKNDVSIMQSSHPVKVYAFDLLELNGEDLLHKPTETRIKLLKQLLDVSQSEKIVMTETTTITDPVTLEKTFKHYVKQNYEGIIIKLPESFYLPGTRNFDWIKLKASAVQGLSDTVDGVVLGYYLGSGVRTKFGIGAILIGIFDRVNEQFVSLAKVGTGFKDQDWKTIKIALDEIQVTKLPENVIIHEALMPDVLVRPKIIAEVEADMITKSKAHGDLDGYSLRFPRLKYFGRDKEAENCTSLAEIKKLFEMQTK